MNFYEETPEKARLAGFIKFIKTYDRQAELIEALSIVDLHKLVKKEKHYQIEINKENLKIKIEQDEAYKEALAVTLNKITEPD